MAVQPHRPAWTDERLDDLNQTMREGFARNGTDHGAIREEIRDLRVDLKSDINRIEQRLGAADERFGSVDQRFDAVDRRFDSVDQRLDSVDRRFDSVDQRFDSVDRRFDSVDRRFDSVDHRFDALQRTLILGFLGLSTTMAAAIATFVLSGA